ncbi:MAG: hypothetical protein K2K06_03085, partial [Oscillospiraceae bacterium]|nr:hypothetical protein [Oscillospiraceae bacterium]
MRYAGLAFLLCFLLCGCNQNEITENIKNKEPVIETDFEEIVLTTAPATAPEIDFEVIPEILETETESKNENYEIKSRFFPWQIAYRDLILEQFTDEKSSDFKYALVYIDNNTSIREYFTRSVNTEVISCVLDIVRNQIDEDFVTSKIDYIANRLLLKEREAQTSVVHMTTNVQKGSLIQAVLYDDENDKHIYLLAKVEHTDFVDDSDFSFKSGFSKDMNCLLNPSPSPRDV